VRGQRPTAGLTGVGAVQARVFWGAGSGICGGSVPPKDEKGGTLPCERDAGYQETR